MRKHLGLDDYITRSAHPFKVLRKSMRHIWKECFPEPKAPGSHESRLQSLLERLNVGVFRSTLDGKLLEANPSCLRMLGLRSIEEARELNLSTFYPDPADREKLMALLREKGMLHETEVQLKRLDGTTFWVALTESLESSEDGMFYIDGLMEDITERKKAELALRESEERYRRLVELSPEAIGVHCEGKIVYINAAGVKLLGGKTAEEFLGEPVLQFVHPDYRELVIGRIQKMLQENCKSDLIEEKFIRKDGKVIDVEVVAIPIQYDNKPAVQVLIRDVTERKRMERELKRREQRFRQLIKNASDIIAVLNPEGKVLYGSPSITSRLGYQIDDIKDRTVFELIHEDDRDEVWRVFQSTLKEPFRVSGLTEFRLKHKNGSYRTLEAIAKNLLDDPAIKGVVINARDITERKELEEQLFQSQKMEAIGRLAGGIAHDFNNLLTAITGYSELILQSIDPDDPVYEDVIEIKKSALRAASLTRQLLAFSRKQVMQPKIINLNDIISDLGKLLKRLIDEHIELTINLAPDLVNIKADPSQIEQVIMNLVVNARDAMTRGGRLTIETENVHIQEYHQPHRSDLMPGEYAILRIQDTGVGMDQNVKDRIFEPFFTTKEHGKGTGLGLSTVYGIVKQSGGFIYVHSEPGEGTVFEIFLPRAEDEPPKDSESMDLPPTLRGHETILVVEDEPLLRELTRRVLRNFGYRVLEAEDGQKALQLFEQHTEKVHLLLTDVILPYLNGRELSEKLCHMQPDLKVLFMSGYTDDAILSHGISNQDHAYIQKPFTAYELGLKVREVLEN